jgi:phosphoglycolate phosphatase
VLEQEQRRVFGVGHVRKRFILFDIDGTLIHSGGAGLNALNRAFLTLTGVPDALATIECAGKTDIQIIRETLGLWELAEDGLVDAVVDRYLYYLPEEASLAQGHLKPGVERLLHALQGRSQYRLGLLTGNLEKGARIKLDIFGLNGYFAVGAFGSDSEDRNHLLPIAVQKLSSAMHEHIPSRDCVVIGDTPRDVECGRIHGAACLAVATGTYSIEALKRAKAHLVLEDLSDTDRILRWIEEGDKG